MSRKRVTIQARELSDMDVNLISLVKRGANRVPFRIVKSNGDDQMLNLSTLFLNKKEATPTVVGVVLAKAEHQEAYTKAFTDAGFEIDHVTETDEGPVSLMFIKGDDVEDGMVFKINEDAAVLVAHCTKGLEMFPDSNSFVENISKAGFAPSFRMANDILTDTIGNIMYTEGDADVTKAQVAKAIEDFKGYIEAVMAEIPVQAFKAEGILLDVQKGLIPQAPPKGEEKKAKKKTPAKKEEGEEISEEESEEETSDAAATKAEGEGDTEAKDDAEVTKDDAAEETTTGDDEGAGDAIAALQKSLDGITETLAGVQTQITEATGAVKQELSERLDTLEAKVKKTDEALAGTVHSEETDDDTTVTPKKSQGGDDTTWDGLLDFGDVEFS